MPKVGNRHFTYSPRGKAAAARYAKKTGKAVEHTKTRKVGKK